MSEPTVSPTPTTTPAATTTDPEVDNGGGLFQDNPTAPAGATTETPAAPPAEPVEGGGGAVEPGTGEPVATPDEPRFTRDDLISILQEVGAGKQAPVAAPVAEPQLTQEQFEKAFNVFKPTEDLVQRLTHETPAVRIKALEEYRDGVMRQAMTMADYRIKQFVNELRTNDIAPLQSYVSERTATEWRGEFFEKYPDLEPYEIIVDAISARLQQDGYTDTSRSKIMERFATESREAVKLLLAKGGNAPAGGTDGKQVVAFVAKAGGRKMSTLTGGGQGGASKPGASGNGEGKYKDLPKNVAAGLSVFD